MVRDYQGRLKLACEQSPVKRIGVPYYDKNGAWKALFLRLLQLWIIQEYLLHLMNQLEI